MSKFSETTITCKRCGVAQPFIMWGLVDATTDRELKEKLVGGELTQFVCKECGWDGPVIHSLLYYDTEKCFMCWLWTDSGDPNQIENWLPFHPDFHLRVVPSLIGLIEKIRIFDANLDDRVIESLKLILPAHVDKDRPNAELEFLFDAVEKSADGQEEIWFNFSQGDEDFSICVGMEYYKTLETRLVPMFQMTVPDKWERVDSVFVVKLWA